MEVMTDPLGFPWLVVHAFLVGWGLLDLFFGFAIFRTLLGAFGALAGALAGAWLASGWVDGWVGPLVGGLIGLITGGLLVWYVSVAGIALVGAAAAMTLAVPLVQGRVEPPWDDAVVGGAMLLGGLLAAVAVRPLIIFATSLSGAFRIVYGGAFLLGHGPNLFFLRQGLIDENGQTIAPLAEGLADALGVHGLLPWLVLGVAFIGMGAQGAFTGRKKESEG